MKRYRIASPAILGLLAVLLGAWSLAPHGAPLMLTTMTPTPTSPPLSFPEGMSANEQALLQSLYDFNPDISSVTSGSLVGSERTALDVMWAQNYNVLQMLRVAMNRARNDQLRAEIRLLYQMRLKDQLLLNQLENQSGSNGLTPTPGPTFTIPVTDTAVPTGTAFVTATAAVTETPGSTATPVDTPTAVPTTAITESPTAVVTSTSAATGSPTAVTTATTAATAGITSTAPPIVIPTASTTPFITETAAVSPTPPGPGYPVPLNNVPILPGTALGQLGFHAIDLNSVFLNRVLHASSGVFDVAFVTQMNAALYMGMDTAREVQSTSGSDVLKSIAVHLAQENQMHLLMLQILGDEIFFGQGLIVRFPTPTGEPALPTPATTESVTPVPTGTITGQNQSSGLK